MYVFADDCAAFALVVASLEAVLIAADCAAFALVVASLAAADSASASA